MQAISFQPSNAKLDALQKATGKRVYTVSLRSGWTCPFAHDCLSKAVVGPDGRRTIKDGPHTQFRCFSASQEVQYTPVYNNRFNNEQLLKSKATAMDMAHAIVSGLPKTSNIIVRIHVGGDFFNLRYFKAWIRVAKKFPNIVFYAYTKSLPYWIEERRRIDELDNFLLTASYGGRHDDLIEKHGLRYAKVVFSEAEASKLGLPIDHDDTHAADISKRSQSFALLLHGIQPKNSEASVALRKLKGKGSYSRKTKVKV